MIHPRRYQHLGEILADAFSTYPSSTACIEAERNRENVRYSYAEFGKERLKIAAWFRSQGLCDGKRIAIVMANQAAWLLAASAAFHVGAVLVPLDSRLTPEEVTPLLLHSEAECLVTEAHLVNQFPDTVTLPILATGVRADRPVSRAVDMDRLPAPTGEVPVHPRTRDDLACIVYSSGTGGTPKGCMLSHNNYLSQYQVLMESVEWRTGERYLSILPANHAIDFMCGFLASLFTGSTIIHQRTLRPEFIMNSLKRYRITKMTVVPMILKAFERSLREKLDDLPSRSQSVFGALTSLNRALTRKAPRPELSKWLMKPVLDAFGGELRTIYCGGAFVDRERAEYLYELGLPVAIGYGLTEACTVATINDLRPFRADSVGSPVPGLTLKIHEPNADGVGEVLLKGDTIFQGYLNAPELTEAAFMDGWFRTGDLGWLDGAHHLHLVGRKKNMIVTAGGKNVYPEDVEAAFEGLDCEELVLFAADYLWPRDAALTGEELVAILRLNEGDSSEAVAASFQKINRRLPEHKRVSRLLFWSEEFPRTTSMKVKRFLLAEELRTQSDRTHTRSV